MLRMPFGKYQGWLLADVPDEYLAWLLTRDLREPLCTAVYEEVDARRQGTTRACRSAPDLQLVRKIVDRGYKVLALEYHPDRGGDVRAMQNLNAATEWLREHIMVLT